LEIQLRFYNTINFIEDLTFDETCKTVEALGAICGYSFFEALYFICGEHLQFCTLLSKETQEFLRDLIAREEESTSGELNEPWENQLKKIMKELNEMIFLSMLRRDSNRFKELMNQINTTKDSKIKN